MNILTRALAGIAILSGATANADVAAVAPGSKEAFVANTASDILSVSNLKIGNWAYKVVSLDSSLNGDTSSTTIVLVGEGEVGSLAGYESAFVLSPTDQLRGLSSATKINNEVKLVFFDIDGKSVVNFVHYDASSKKLIVNSQIFSPKKIVHSSGKAYTECQDAHEQQQSFKGRKICVNSAGEYYFIAN